MNMSIGAAASYSSIDHMRAASPPPPSGDEIVKALDQDGNGSIGRTEIAEKKEHAAKLLEQFFQIDSDGDETLTASELDAYGQSEKLGKSEQDSAARVWEAARDKDQHMRPPPPPKQSISNADAESVVAALFQSSSQNSAVGASQSILQAMYQNTQSLFA